ncbi:MAG: hypothetical protein ACTHU0_21700 [Kofleriaceae bacterium]
MSVTKEQRERWAALAKRVDAARARLALAAANARLTRAFDSAMRVLRVIDERPIACGHRVKDLISGTDPSTGRKLVTKCGACLAEQPKMSHAGPSPAPEQERLAALSERQTQRLGRMLAQVSRQRDALAVALGNMLAICDGEFAVAGGALEDLEPEDQAAVHAARQIHEAHKAGTLGALLDRWDAEEKQEATAAARQAAS